MTPAEFQQRLSDRATAAGLTIPAELGTSLEAYYRLLATWNRKLNLTSVDLDGLPDNAVDRLFIEPIKAATFCAAGASVMDVGSGGGSPAIPFALAAHASRLTMIESRTRKSVFLREAARTVCLQQAAVLTSRVEDLGTRGDLQRTFDVLTIRAVRVDERAVTQLRRFLKPGGSLYLFRPAASRQALQPGRTVPLTSASELFILAVPDCST